MAVSLKTDLRFPESGQHGHGSRIIHYPHPSSNKLHSNTEFMSEKEMYAYLVQISEFLKKYYELDINSEVDRENNYDPMGWLF